MPSAIFAANGSSRLAIRARRDSIGRPWPIDPTSKAVFGALKGELSIPLKSAEVFGFDRANRTGTFDLVLWSPDGDSDGPLDCSPDVTKWNPGVLKAAEESRITLRFIQATGCIERLDSSSPITSCL